ncbi:hypothetical protein Tco_0294801 [Tanacetum coccineum]
MFLLNEVDGQGGVFWDFDLKVVARRKDKNSYCMEQQTTRYRCQEFEYRSQHEYMQMFGTRDYNNIYDTVSVAGRRMVMPHTGLVIASKYNKVVVSLSNDGALDLILTDKTPWDCQGGVVLFWGGVLSGVERGFVMVQGLMKEKMNSKVLAG